MNFEGIIQIESVIVHILDKKGNRHRLSDLPIVTDDKLNNLIIKHINNSIKNDSRIFAKFNDEDNEVKKSCINILKDGENFIEESKKISYKLFRAMQGSNAASANFLIVKFKHGEENAIALLKLDFNDNFYTEEVNENGKVKIEVKVMDAGFNSKQKIQKCAFIYDDIIKNNESDILIVDNQDKEKGVSYYFATDFLDCELVNDGVQNTKLMIKETMNFINKKYENNPEEQLSKTFMVSKIFSQNDEFILEKAINILFDDESTRNEFKEGLKDKKLDYKFVIDENNVNKRLKNRSIQTVNGILIKANAKLFNRKDIDYIENKEYDEGYVDVVIKKVKINKNNF